MPPKKKQSTPRHRDAQVVIIFGKNGTGKSYFCKQIVEAMGDKALIITYAGMPKIWENVPVLDASKPSEWREWETGIKQVIAADYEEGRTGNNIFELIYKYYRKGVVVFDDCREYIASNRITDYPFLKKLLSSFRHLELDMFFVMHAPTDVPPQVWMYTTTTWVGHTNKVIKPSDLRIGNAEEIIQAQEKIKPEFLKREARGDGSHRGLFIRIKS